MRDIPMRRAWPRIPLAFSLRMQTLIRSLACRSAPLMALLIAGPALALSPQRVSPPVSPPPPPPPQMRLLVAGADVPVNLETVRVRTEINGNLAQTAIELTFFNPNGRQLEGELQFPLAPGQTVSGFAMDFNGKLREAVPVDKSRGQEIFEDVTRQRVDPALLSMTQGNNFKLRVYPLLARQKKTVVLRISESLGGAASLVYRLPLVYAGRVGSLDFEATLRGITQAPHAAGLLRAAQGRKGEDGYRIAITRTAVRLDGAAEIAYVAAAQPVTLTEAFDGDAYFYAQPRIAGPSVVRALPGSVALLWDSSGSGAERDHDREFALLDAYFKHAGTMQVSLTRFREAVEPAETYTVSGGDWSALRAALEATVYDGATRLPGPAVLGSAEEALLFTDGLENFGTGVAPWPRPLYTVTAAHKRNAVLLAHLAEASGGRLIDLAEQSATSAAAQLLSRGPRVIGVAGGGVSEIVLGSRYPRDGRIVLAGKLAEGGGQVRLRVLQADGRETQLLMPIPVGQNPSTLAAHAWARLRVEELDGEYSLNRAAIKRLGQRFGLVTRETSLIILDSAADYARYEVEPPAELRDLVENLRGMALRQSRGDRAAHLEMVVRLFEQKQAWWNQEFPKGGKQAPVVDRATRVQPSVAQIQAQGLEVAPGLQGSARSYAATPATPPAPPPPSPAMPAPIVAPVMDAPAPMMAAPPSRMSPAGSNFGLRGSEVNSGVDVQAGASAKRSDQSTLAIGIQLQKANPDAPYARRLREADAATRYRVYLDERASYTNSTAFFLDAADIFFDKGDKVLGLRVLGNLAEMDLENRHILRILGYRLLQAGEPALAIPVFQKVLELSPEEPQSYRDLGLAYAADGQTQKAVDKLYEVVLKPWHNRFPEVELISLAELNALIASAPGKVDTTSINPRLLKNLALDLRVVLTWDADNTDIDLWVTDPNGEKAYYQNRLTYQGGRMSQDFTGGYGPEEFSLKTAKPGKYKIEAQFYGHRQQVVAGATTLQVRLQSGFGKPGGGEKLITLRLAGQQEVVYVGEFEVPAR